MYQRILVPYDGSKPSANALRHAIGMAESKRSAEITLLYVVEQIVLPPLINEKVRSRRTGELVDREQLLKEMYFGEKKSATSMLEKATRSARAKKIRTRTRVTYGLASEQIVEYARKEKIDLIVIGNVGLSGISRLKAIGSVSRAVSEHAPCPVMIVH